MIGYYYGFMYYYSVYRTESVDINLIGSVNWISLFSLNIYWPKTFYYNNLANELLPASRGPAISINSGLFLVGLKAGCFHRSLIVFFITFILYFVNLFRDKVYIIELKLIPFFLRSSNFVLFKSFIIFSASRLSWSC